MTDCLTSPGIWRQRTNVKDSRKKLRAGVWWSHSWLWRVVQHPTQLFRFYGILQVPKKEEIFSPGDIVWSLFLYFKKIYETHFSPECSKLIFMVYIVYKFVCCSLNCWDEMDATIIPSVFYPGFLADWWGLFVGNQLWLIKQNIKSPEMNSGSEITACSWGAETRAGYKPEHINYHNNLRTKSA